MINYYKSRHNDPIEPGLAMPPKSGRGEPQDMSYISTGSHAGDPHRGLMVFRCDSICRIAHVCLSHFLSHFFEIDGISTSEIM